jgi:hypothetical protein
LNTTARGAEFDAAGARNQPQLRQSRPSADAIAASFAFSPVGKNRRWRAPSWSFERMIVRRLRGARLRSTSGIVSPFFANRQLVWPCQQLSAQLWRRCRISQRHEGLVAMLPAVAIGTVVHNFAISLLDAQNLRQLIHRTGRQKDRTGMMLALRRLDGETQWAGYQFLSDSGSRQPPRRQ